MPVAGGPLYHHSALEINPDPVHPAKQILVVGWWLKEVGLLWPNLWGTGVANRGSHNVIVGLQGRLSSDKAKEFLDKSASANSGYDSVASAIAERWVGIMKVRGIRLNASYSLFGDVVVVNRFLEKPPGFENRAVTGVCLDHNPTISGGVTVGTVVLHVEVSAKVRKLGECQRWGLHGCMCTPPRPESGRLR